MWPIVYWAALDVVGIWLSRIRLTTLSLWWWALLLLWLTAPRQLPPTVTPLQRRAILTLACIAGAIYCDFSFSWFQQLTGFVRFGGERLIQVSSAVLHGLIAVVLTALVLARPFCLTLGHRSGIVLAVAAGAAGAFLFGTALVSGDDWRLYPLANEMEMFYWAALVGTLWIAGRLVAQRTPPVAVGKSANPRSAFRTWRFIFGGTVGAMLLMALGGFLLSYKTRPTMPVWREQFFEACFLHFFWTIILAGAFYAFLAVRPAFRTRPIAAALAQLSTIFVCGAILLVTMPSQALEAGNTLLEGTAANLGTLYSFKVNQGSTEMIVSGEIGPGFADALEAAIAAHPEVRLLRLRSGGGIVDEARSSADLLHRDHLDTIVTGECSSACTLMFLGGINRSVTANGRLGFHSLQSAFTLPDACQRQRETFSAYGVEPAFIDRACRIPPSQMWYPSRAELFTAHVISTPGF